MIINHHPKFIIIVTILHMVTIFPALAAPMDELAVQAVCGVAQVEINEVNYRIAADNEAQFIELHAAASTPLDFLELHLVDQDGDIYDRYSLAPYQISTHGYFLLASVGDIPLLGLKIEDKTMATMPKPNLIREGTPGGIGLYHVEDEQYCNFINYGGSVVGHEDALNIGIDSIEDGEDRSCTHSSWGWWSCGNIATPAASNETVAIDVQKMATQQEQMLSSVFVVLMITLLSLTTIYQRLRSN